MKGRKEILVKNFLKTSVGIVYAVQKVQIRVFAGADLQSALREKIRYCKAVIFPELSVVFVLKEVLK